MSVNLDGVVNGMNAFIPLFLEQNEGHVVNTASEAGLSVSRGWGLITRANLPSWASRNRCSTSWPIPVRTSTVSVLCPNFVRTRIFESERNMPKELASYAENPEGAENQEGRGRVGERGH